MSEFDKLQMPFLTTEDEEYQMLIEVAELYQKLKQKTAEKRSGDATEIVIRNHLLDKKLNITLKPELMICGSNLSASRIDSLLLKPIVDPDRPTYKPHEVDTVIEVKNNCVANQSEKIIEKFDKIAKVSENFHYAVIILSERKGYTYEITEASLKNEKYRPFTLVSRKIYPRGGLYLKSNIIAMLNNNEMKKTGDWEKLIKYLKGK